MSAARTRAVNGTCVLVNGKIVTVDDEFSVRQAVAIDGERVAAVGSDAAILAQAGPQATVIDLGGKTVIPGLIDNHNHFVRATEHVEVRLEGVRTRAAALDLEQVVAGSFAMSLLSRRDAAARIVAFHLRYAPGKEELLTLPVARGK